MILAQVLGALLSMEVFFAILCDPSKTLEQQSKDFPQLVAHTSNWEKACLIEMVVTFLFVSSVLLVKDDTAGKQNITVGG